MKRSFILTLGLLGMTSATSALASADVAGEVTSFSAAANVTERCIRITPMTGGKYSPEDLAEEARLCSMDFRSGDFALCPKVASTSPGTLVYGLAGGPWAGRADAFEKERCLSGGIIKEGANGAPVSWKMSVNTRSTSATFANSSAAYYHFSRYFGATVHVPVAVLRTMDRGEHRRRVSERGLAFSANKSALRMNHAAWQALAGAEADPASYSPTAELFTAEGQVYGVLLRPEGKRYSEEINGTRASGWGDGQNRDFQKTAPFTALRTDKPLMEAIEQGRSEAFRDPRIAKATGKDATPLQMVYWMSDLVDITLLDYLFSQQDRVGNIDYLDYWHWVQDGRVERRAASNRTPPADIAAHAPVWLRRTELGDNDAGVRTSYVNYTRRTGMLESLRHTRASAYRRLMELHKDFAAGGPLHAYVQKSFGFSEAEFLQLKKNTAAAAKIMNDACRAGRLRFDVDPEQMLLKGKVEPETVDCASL